MAVGTLISTHDGSSVVSHDDIIKWKHFPRYWPFVRGNSPVTGEFPTQRPVTQSFDIFFDLHLNKRLSEQSWGWWFETLSCPLWCHCNEYPLSCLCFSQPSGKHETILFLYKLTLISPMVPRLESLEYSRKSYVNSMAGNTLVMEGARSLAAMILMLK